MNAPVDIATAGMALPARYYTSPEIYAESHPKIFFKCWHHVCHQSQIPEIGDYLAFTVLDQDLVVVRDREGGVRCFYNVCQHRGHSLVEGTGRTRVLVCPYHAWSYELDGRLRAAPHAGAGFDKSKICLTEVKVDIFLGFVFVNFDHDARPMRETFPGVEQEVQAMCPEIETRIFAHEHTAQEYCNWLIAVENYNECYHCGHVHKAFAEGVIDPGSYDIQPDTHARVLRHKAQRASGEGAWISGAGSDYGSFFLYPMFSLQIYPGGVVNTYSWRPLQHDDTLVRRGWLSKDGVVDDQLQSVIDLDHDTTFAEDLALVKAVQRGLTSRGYRPGPLVVADSGVGINSEHSIAALHQWVREDLDGEA